MQAYPLQWPRGRGRRPSEHLKRGKFSAKNSYGVMAELSLSAALTRLFDELGRIAVFDGIVVSTNLEVRRDGLPRSGQRIPADPGVCIYFNLDGKPRAMPCDTYETVEQNIAAIAAHIEATRAIERHGVATVAEMFEGFTALPAPDAKKHWTEILGLKPDATTDEVEAAYRAKAKKAHPDMGGSDSAMAELNRARQEAMT